MAATGVFTGNLTNRTLIIKSYMSIEQISLACTTDTAGTVQGNLVLLGDLASSPITLSKDSVPTIITYNSVMEDITIEAPTGCNIEILATKK